MAKSTKSFEERMLEMEKREQEADTQALPDRWRSGIRAGCSH